MDIENDLNTIDFAITPSALAATKSARAASFQKGVPSGTYVSTVKNACRSTHTDGHDVIKIELEVSAGSHAGTTLAKFYNLKTKKAVQFFRREMNEIGAAVATREELDGLCSSLVGIAVVAQVADHPSGNQVVFLKKGASRCSSIDSSANALWT